MSRSNQIRRATCGCCGKEFDVIPGLALMGKVLGHDSIDLCSSDCQARWSRSHCPACGAMQHPDTPTVTLEVAGAKLAFCDDACVHHYQHGGYEGQRQEEILVALPAR